MDQYFLTLTNGGGPLCTIQRLKAICEEALSNFAFNFKLCRYNLDNMMSMALGRGLHSFTLELNLSDSRTHS
jgi:hypothetical protein